VNVSAKIQRYMMINDAELKLAAQRKEEYFRVQMSRVSGTVHGFDKKKSQAKDA